MELNYKNTCDRYNKILSRREKLIEKIRNAEDLDYLMKKLGITSLSYLKLDKLLCRIKNKDSNKKM